MPRISDAQGNEAKLNSDGSMNAKVVATDATPVPTKQAGSLAKLSTEADPPGEEGNTLTVFYPNPDDNKYFRYYSGAWREI